MMIRFVSGKGWDSKLIEWYSRCRWSHVEFLFDAPDPLQSQTYGAQLSGGVKYRYARSRRYEMAAAFETWEVPVTKDQYWLFVKLRDDALDAPYDWKAIVSFVLGPWRWHTKGAWICSGFVAGVLQSLNLIPRVMDPEMYDPRDIYLIIQQIPGARKL